MKLDGLGRRAHAELGSEELGHGRFLLEWMAMLLEPGGVVDELLGGFDLGRHVREGEMHALEARDRPAELLPRGRIGQALVERALCQAEGEGGDADPSAVERVQELAEPVVYRSENIFLGNDRVLEDQLA